MRSQNQDSGTIVISLVCIQEITLRTPDETTARSRVLERRAAHRGGYTGWRDWLLNVHARLRDSDEAGKHMGLLLKDSTLANMLDNHPPFQIDGNFRGCTGIQELSCETVRAKAIWIWGGESPSLPQGGGNMGSSTDFSSAAAGQCLQWKYGKIVNHVTAHNTVHDDFMMAIQYISRWER
jgi:hypothetical protein